jgi:FkbM family methyltransferase
VSETSAARRSFASALRFPLTLIPKDVRVPILTGALRGKWWVSTSGTHGCWLGWYESETQRVFTSTVRRGDTVFDIGANVGFFTLLASILTGENGRVVAFEPLPRNIGYLKRNLAMNRVVNTTIMEVAVSDRPGQAFLQVGANPSEGSLAEQGQPVDVIALDDLAENGLLPLPDVMKIDVEGAESRVLHGALALLRKARPTLILSTHGYLQHDSCWKLLEGLGYQVTLRRDGSQDGMYEVLARHPDRSTERREP